MNPATQALIETIGAAGYVVNIEYAGGHPVVTATSEEMGERWAVRDVDQYAAVARVTEQIGFDIACSGYGDTVGRS